MTNFAALGFIDPFDLIGSLPRRMGLFKAGVLSIRTDSTNALDLDTLNKWPELKRAIAHIKHPGGVEVEFGEIFLQLFPPDYACLWSPPETGAYWERFSRLVMSLRTNPLFVHHSGAETQHLPPGVVTWINQLTWTSAINMGETQAIVLVTDVAKKEA